MNKKLLIGLVVLLLLAGGAYFLSTKKDSNMTSTSQDASSETSTNSKTGSLGELFAGAGGESKTCTFENTTSAGVSKGVVYTGDNRMRGDFSVEVGGKTTESHMIVIDNTSYIWQDGEKTGIKAVFGQENLDLVEPEEVEDSDNRDVVEPEGKYECKAWSVNSSFFDLPKGVEFASVSEMMKTVPSGSGDESTDNPGANCSVCDSLSGDQKTQCLTALNCS